MQPDRPAVVRELADRIEAAAEEFGLEWAPRLKPGYIAFQRPGEYSCAGVEISRDRPVDLWIKLPLPPGELRQLGHDVTDPCPGLDSRWDASNKQWRWAVPGLAAIPDVARAVELRRPYQPPVGSDAGTRQLIARALSADQKLPSS